MLNNSEKTYLFYDIETTGLNKCFDQVIQFAGIRTDSNLNELERYEYFLRLNRDVVPSPQAFITHRISLTQLEKGLDEYQAITKIHSLFNRPGTISIGYNSLGFDDEFLRFSFHRNLLPVYTHQYANQCSRMDLYPMTVMYFLFKNELLTWPDNNLKLENITKLNALASGAAHNAMVDVAATLNLAKCLRQDSKTWEYLTGFFDKQIDLERCNQVANSDFGIMIDGKFSHVQQYQSAVMPLGTHHHYKNQFIWLRLDTENIEQATCENFLDHTWVVNKKMGEPAWVLPMKQRYLHSYLVEKQPFIKKTLDWVKSNNHIIEKIKYHYRNYTYPAIANLDVDAALYEKGFLSFQDQEICQKIHLAAPENKLKFLPSLSQPHLKEILIRIMARHFPDFISSEDMESFQSYVSYIQSNREEEKYLDYRGSKRLTPKKALQEINDLKSKPLDDEQQKILNELEIYIKNNFIQS